MKKILFLFTVSLLGISFIIFSCKKEEEPDTDTTSAIDYTKAEEAGTTTFSTVNHYGINQEEIKCMRDITGQVIITVDTIGNSNNNFWPRKLTLDFGEGALCADGHTRKGVLYAVFSAHWSPDSLAAGTNVIVTFSDFYVDNVQRFGTFTITYNGKPNGGPSYTIDANDAKLIFSNGDEINWNSTRTTEWIAGYDNLDESDDIFQTTGNATGVNRVGRSYEASITTPIKTDRSCQYSLTEGVVEITPSEKATRKIDYGDGSCDNKATLSVNGVSINFNF